MKQSTLSRRNNFYNVIFSKKLHYLSFLMILLLGSWVISFGQTAQFWCFGNYAGINFNDKPPTVVTSILMSTPEGCASIINKSGQVQYYSNGKKLWDRNNMLIANDLNGSIFSTQSVLIMRHPKSVDDKTFVFTTDAMEGSNGLQYTVLSCDTIQSKNNPLLSNATERITIALHCNQHDYWIITHAWNSNAFYAYKLTKYGLDTVPSISYAGSVHTGNLSNGAGYLKASLRGNFVAQAIMGSGKLEVFRFDGRNGILYDPITIPNIPNAYGVEFSLQEHYLYVSSASGAILQYGLPNYTTNDIIQSKEIILQSPQLVGALQIAVDNRIYVSVDNKYYLACITSPNHGGNACNYDPNYKYLNGKKTEAGLPPEIPKPTNMGLQTNAPCFPDTSYFDVAYYFPYVDSVFWDFGDLNSKLDTSTKKSCWYVYPHPGHYNVVLYIYYCGSVDTILQDANILDGPYVDIGSDTSICANDTFKLCGQYPDYDYLWSTGSTNICIKVTQPGTYWVEVSNICGVVYDTVEIVELWPVPYLSLPADTDICAGDSIILYAGDSNYIYTWQGNYSALYYTAKDAGNYVLSAINKYGCKNFDDFSLSLTYPPEVNIGKDTSICRGNFVLLDAGFGFNYLWNNGNTTQYNHIDTTGLIIVDVSNKCGDDIDSIYVTVEECIYKIYVPNCFTPNGDGMNDLFSPKGYSLDWNTFEMFIYNRWGEQIYFTNDVNKGWDGTKDGNKCPLGVYAWLLKVKDIYGDFVKRSGTVTLLR